MDDRSHRNVYQNGLKLDRIQRDIERLGERINVFEKWTYFIFAVILVVLFAIGIKLGSLEFLNPGMQP